MKIYVNAAKRQVAVVGHTYTTQCGAITMLMRAAAFASDFAVARVGLTAVQIRPELAEDFEALYFGLRALSKFGCVNPIEIIEVSKDAWKAAAIEI